MPEMLRGKVAQIINERELAINIGAKAGVRPGMRFSVLGPPADIKDPDTGEILGSEPRTKVRVEAFQIRDRFTVCQTYETQGGLLGNYGLMFGKGIFSGLGSAQPETLRAKGS